MTKQTTPTKKAQLIALLQRDGGATLDQIVETTGWQPHSCRASLTRLRKSGYAIDSEVADGSRCYRITHVPGEGQ